jgi:chromosomal replication initiation ATPase DnaA
MSTDSAILTVLIRDAENQIFRATGKMVKLVPETRYPEGNNPKAMLYVIAKAVDMCPSDYLNTSRKTAYTELRYLGCYLLRKYFALSIRQIGRLIYTNSQCKSLHSNVAKALSTCKDRIDSKDEQFCEKYHKAEKHIKKWLRGLK